MKVHNHSLEQQTVLRQLLTETANQLLGVEFADPANDAANIRRHAHLSGRLAVYKELYDDEYPNPEVQPVQE